MDMDIPLSFLRMPHDCKVSLIILSARTGSIQYKIPLSVLILTFENFLFLNRRFKAGKIVYYNVLNVSVLNKRYDSQQILRKHLHDTDMTN